MQDLLRVTSVLRKSSTQQNGFSNIEHDLHPSTDFDAIERLLSRHSSSPTIITSVQDSASTANAGQVITLRSNDGGVVKQLFTGLRKIPRANIELEDIDIRQLPSGFDVADAAVIDSAPSTDHEPRTFGDVFRPARNLRPLDQPKSSRGTKDTFLNFVKPIDNQLVGNRDDYRSASLSSGSWLQYAMPDLEDGKLVHKDATAVKNDPASMFKAAFSSFAPTQDNTSAVVPNSDRSRQWFRKYGDLAVNTISGRSASDEWSTNIYPDIDDDYQQLIDNFVSTSEEDAKEIPESTDDSEKDVLEEISDLLLTLSSYQHLRDLDRTRVFAASAKPVAPEVDVYDLLRDQLKLLISTLPPFAVAKLDGNQLEALNLDTKIVVNTPDIAGTGQPDEGFLQRARLLQAQQQPPARSVQSRNSYTTSTPSAAYNAQPRAYNSNVATTPSMPGYAQRGAQMYNTPRPNVATNTTSYSQSSYQQRPQQPYPGATIQQFQRMQNGYTQNSQTPYQPRSSIQTPYQPQTTNTMQSYGRPNSPAKALTNGTSQTQPYRNSYSAASSTALLQGPYAQANAHATIQQVKAAHQLQQQQSQQSLSQSPQPQSIQSVQQQRQASGTPQPQLQPQAQSQSNSSNMVNGNVNGVNSQNQLRAASTSTPTPAVGASA